MNATKATNALFASANRNIANIEQHMGERVSVDYAADGFVYIHLLHSGRRYGLKMRGTKVSRSFLQV